VRPVEALGVTGGQVACAPPTSTELRTRGFRVVPILKKHHWIAIAPDRDLTHLAGGDFLICIVEQSDARTWVGSAHRARLGCEQRGAPPNDVVHFSLTEDLVDGYTEPGLRPVHHGWADCLSATHEAAKIQVKSAARVGSEQV
jgi:hypothetical protein